MPRSSGLNVATQAGEGGAYILNWNEFDNTLNQLYARDAANLKAIQGQNAKMNIMMADSAKGLRPADMANFKNGFDKFMQASTMLESREIMSNPNKMAYWKHQQEESFYNNMALAQQSADNTKFLADMWSNVAKNPSVFKDYAELQKMGDAYNKSPSALLNNLGLNTAVPWLRPADAYPQEDFDKHALGLPLQKEQRTPVIDPKTGIVKGNWVNQTEVYNKTPSQIAKDVSFGMLSVPSVAGHWQNKFKYDVANQPDVVEKTLKDAQAILDADPSNKGYKLGKGYADYAAANYINQSQPRDVGDKKFETSDEWKEHENELLKADEHKFRYGLAGYEHQLRMQETGFKSWLQFKKSNGLDFSGEEMYDAAKNPGQTYTLKVGGKNVSVTGAELLDKRLAEIMSKIPKDYDYVILNRFNIVNAQQRRRLVDKLFNPNDPIQKAAAQPLYQSMDGAKSHDEGVKNFLDALNKALGLNLNMNDLSTSTPIIMDAKGGKTAIPIATNNYDQFISKLAQLIQQEKPKGAVSDYDDDEDFGTTTIDGLNDYLGNK